MPTGQKSDLHPSTLTINDMNPGRTVVPFNQDSGVLGTFVVVERPVIRSMVIYPTWEDGATYVVVVPHHAKVVYRNLLVVKLRDVETGDSEYHSLRDLGVVSYPEGFNRANFVVDHRKRHLLPRPVR